jgi:hypothetical protein
MNDQSRVVGARRDFTDSELLNPGEYGRLSVNGQWYAETPNGHGANLSRHTVTEHEDGTITVSPSILVSNHTGALWHGHLVQGVWEECK